MHLISNRVKYVRVKDIIGQSRLASFGVDVDFYTVGYERLSPEELFLLLRCAGVRCLADVRARPWSRVPDYGKEALESRLDEYGRKYEYGIKYVSMSAVGNPYCEPDWKERYRKMIESRSLELEKLHSAISACRSALMCYEKDPVDCHRSILSGIMASRYGLSYADLRA